MRIHADRRRACGDEKVFADVFVSRDSAIQRLTGILEIL
jgi:hypothetical protein